MANPGKRWPVILSDGELTLRPLRRSDRRVWERIRATNREWLGPWEATTPRPDLERSPNFSQLIRRSANQARAGQALPWSLWARQDFIGQLTVSGIVGGAARLCHIGYWIDERYAGRGYMPRAVAMAVHYLFEQRGLHRIEIAIRPENHASLRVVAKLGFEYEGRRPKFLHIDGDWRDHDVFTLTCEQAAHPEHPLRKFTAGVRL